MPFHHVLILPAQIMQGQGGLEALFTSAMVMFV